MKKFVEDAILAGVRKTNDGYLVAAVKCARTGIQYYTGDELDRPDLGVVAVYRPESEVFSKDSLATYVGKPVTDNHPPVAVDSANWKDYSGGSIGEGVLRDGEFVRIPVTLMDKSLVDAVEAGKREISMGYTMTLDWTAGTTPEGEGYQAIQRDIKINHLAVVDKGRAGKECRLGDGDTWANAPSPGQKPTNKAMSDTLQKVLVDGLSVETTEAGAQAISKLTKDNEALQAKVDANDASHKEAIAAKDKELAAKDAEIDKLKASQIDDAEIDKRVEARATLLSDAAKLAKDADFSGKTDIEIKRAAVEAVRGADSMKDKSDDYVVAAFDLAIEDAKDGKGDQTYRKAVESRDHKATDDNGQAEYEKNLQDAWKSPAAA